MTIPDTNVSWESWINLDGGDAHTALTSYINWLKSVNGGVNACDFDFTTGASFGTATITSTGAASNDETHTIANVTFTAKTSGATGNQWNLSGTVATQATNIAAAINASTNLTGVVTATSSAGVVTLTAAVPGEIGNGLEMTESLSNVTISAFTTEDTGNDTSIYSVDLS